MLRYIPLSVAFGAASLFALPQHPEIRAGSVDFSQAANLLEIRATDGAIIHWSDFSIQPHELTRFIQPGSKARVLNRVTGAVKSSLLGALEANGQIYLMNPHGVIIGKDAVIRTNGLFVTTFDLDDDLFTRDEWLLKGDSETSIINHGSILAGDGDVYLIAQKVENYGRIKAAGAIELAAGKEVLVRPEGGTRIAIKPDFSDGSLINEGSLEALEIELRAAVNPYSLAIRHSGEAQAISIVEKDGNILLCTEGRVSIDGKLVGDKIDVWGDSVEVESNAYLQGSTITVGEDWTRYVRVDQGATLTAADKKGNFSLWGTDVCAFDGSIEMNGGFVEISSNGLLMPQGSVNTNGGMLLLDPTTVTINAISDTNLGPFTFVPPTAPPPPAPGRKYSFSMGAATIFNANLQTFLATNNVLINTASAFAGAGDIIFDASVNWASNFSLYLIADHDIRVSSAVSIIPIEINCSGAGGVIANATNDILVSGGSMLGAHAAIITNSGAISLTAGNNLTLQGGAGTNTYAEINSTSGPITGVATTNLQVLGGLNSGAHAAILNNTQSITLSAGMDGSLNGGSGSDAYAEISSIAGTVTLTNIGNDLTLSGGNANGTYAQIGKGTTIAGASVTSNINIVSVGNNLNVIGSSLAGGTNAYAQIGHSPFPGNSSVAGNIQIEAPFAVNGNNITLSGGTEPGTTAIIGHGNPQSAGLGICSGEIHVFFPANIALNGGSNTDAHAVIGFANPAAGSTAFFNCTSSLVDVETTVFGDIVLTAGSAGSNAVIGYYNDTNTTSQTVTINSIKLVTTGANKIQLEAGTMGMGFGGVAAIGTLGNMGSADSSITATTSQFQILGPQVAGRNGSARIVNQKPPCVAPCLLGCNSTARTIQLNAVTGLGTVNIVGGDGSVLGFADIYSSGTLDIEYTGNMHVNDNAVLQSGYAHVVACGSVFINATTIGLSLLLQGGIVSTADALIESFTGVVNWGTVGIGNSGQLRVGSPISQARSQILTAAGQSVFHCSSNISILGGAPGGGLPEPYAQIGSTNGFLSLHSTAGALAITGGTAANSFAQVASANGDITLAFNNGGATLNAGTASQAYAQIGYGILTPNPVTVVNSNISCSALNGNLILNGGPITAPGAYAQIGLTPVNGGTTASATGFICFEFISGAIQLNGGAANQTTAIIGHGNELTPFLGTASGSINMTANIGGITLQPGIPQTSHAIIGFHNPTGGSSVAFNVTSSPIQCGSSTRGIILESRGGNILATGGLGVPGPIGSNAIIGYYNNTNVANTVNVMIDTINVTAIGSNTITLQAHRGGITGGVAAIGTFANAPSNAFSSINVNASSLFVLGPIGPMEDSAARIVNSRPGSINPASDTSILTTADIVMRGGTGTTAGFADMYSADNLTIRFFGNCSINNTLQHGYAQIVAARDVQMNIGGVGNNLTVIGGDNPIAIAKIMSNAGQCLVGGFSPGPTNITIGDPTSLATSSIVAVQSTCGVAASQFIKLFGGAGPNISALIQNTNGPINVSAGSFLSLLGGSASFATAEIQNTFQGITLVTSGTDMSGDSLIVTGGSGTDAFAQIGTFFGDILGTSIGGNLLLAGGTNTNAFAQIGMGEGHLDPTHLIIQSNINFQNVNGNVTLQGGTAVGDIACYAQIGHSPFGLALPYSASGSVTVNSQKGVFLNGGVALNTSATIGHGNPLTSQLSNASGGMSVSAFGLSGVVFNPGTGANTHATLGFFSPFAGSTSGFIVNSSGISVTTVSGPISIIAANGNNATIGYYNAATPTPVQVSLNNVILMTNTFPPSPPNQILLQADNGGPTNGIASVGTFAASMGALASTNNILITTYELDVRGPIAGQNGQSLIYNSIPCNPPCSPCTFLPNDMTIMTTNLNINGGTGIAPGFAAIYSSQDMEIDFKGLFNLNLDPLAPATLQTLDGTVVIGRNLTVNPQGHAGDMFVLGGATPAVLSQMVSLTGNMTWGDKVQDFDGVKNLTIGRTDMMGPARIFTCPATGGDIDFLGQTITIQGGLAMNTPSDFNANGKMEVLAKGNITLNAGPAINAGALMNATGGPFLVVSRGEINLTGTSLSPAAFTNENDRFQVEATNDINILSNSTFRNNGNGTSLVYSGNNLTLNNLGSIINFGTGSMTVFAGVSLFAQMGSLISTNTGAMALVVDNNYPTPPGIGNGFVYQDASSSFDSAGGTLRIFTARRILNTLDGTINGQLFVPGIEFINSATEIWGPYYPSFLGGNPFTVFYKDFIPNPSPNVIPTIRSANNEFTQVTDTFDDFLFDPVYSVLSYDRNAYANYLHPQFAMLSYQVVPDTTYTNIRRLYRNYNLKKIDTLK
jgi:filamentous hemagglutinin family protein